MPNRKFNLHDGKRGAALAVRLTPKASFNKVVGITDDGTVKVHLTASSVDGDAANDALLAFMADVLGVTKSRLDIVAGDSGYDKIIAVMDMNSVDVHQRILAYV